MVYIRY